MRALAKYGDSLGGLRLIDIEEPVCGEDDVIIEVKAASICGADRKHYKIDNHSTLFNHVRGHEFSGTICEVGKNVRDWKVGQRVVSDNTGYVCGHCPACEKGDFLLCPHRKNLGTGLNGAFTKYVRVPGDILKIHKRALWEIPENLTFEEVCIMDPIANAYKALCQRSHFLPGEDIVIFGMGPIGMLTIQFAKMMGGVNIVVIGREDDRKVRLPIAQKMGLTHFVSSNNDNVVEKCLEICGENCGTIVDCVGSPECLKQGLEIVRPNGEFIRVGTRLEPLDFSINSISDREVSIHGHMGYDTESWRNCLNLLKNHRIDAKSMITHVLPLSQWEKGFELMSSHDAIKVVLYYDED